MYTPVCVSAVTDGDGIAMLRIRIPGSFSALEFDPSNPVVEGRFLTDAAIWADDPAPGDRVYGFAIEDDKNMVPEELKSLFPEYPILGRFGDTNVTEPTLEGSYLPPGKPVTIRPEEVRFIASELSVIGFFRHGTDTVGKTVRANFNWGKWT